MPFNKQTTRTTHEEYQDKHEMNKHVREDNYYMFSPPGGKKKDCAEDKGSEQQRRPSVCLNDLDECRGKNNNKDDDKDKGMEPSETLFRSLLEPSQIHKTTHIRTY